MESCTQTLEIDSVCAQLLAILFVSAGTGFLYSKLSSRLGLKTAVRAHWALLSLLFFFCARESHLLSAPPLPWTNPPTLGSSMSRAMFRFTSPGWTPRSVRRPLRGHLKMEWLIGQKLGPPTASIGQMRWLSLQSLFICHHTLPRCNSLSSHTEDTHKVGVVSWVVVVLLLRWKGDASYIPLLLGSDKQDNSVLLLSHISGNHVIYIKSYSRQTHNTTREHKQQEERCSGRGVTIHER